MTLGSPLVSGMVDVPAFDRDALIKAPRTDQAGESTFPEFLSASWHAGVVRYDVDFDARTVAYYGCNGEEYVEAYPVANVECQKAFRKPLRGQTLRRRVNPLYDSSCGS